MQRLLSRFLHVVSIVSVCLGSVVYAQAPPADFKFSATAGGIAPWSEKETISIDSSGHATYVRYNTGLIQPILAESTFTVSPSDLQQLWKAIQDSSFFTLNSSYVDTMVLDGSFAKVRVRANGQSHQVLVRNTVQTKIQAIISSLNAIAPGSIQLLYTPPEKYNIVPHDPCGPFPGTMGLGAYGNPDATNPKEVKARSRPPSYSITAVPELIHPGTAVSYGLPLQKAVGKGIAKLRSKGQFLGDAASLTVDNRNQPPGKSIDINLYLEFWGPYATQENVLKVMSDILAKWIGRTTSGGTPINMKIIPRLDPTATAPPGTPGFHQIELVPKGTGRSHCDEAVPVNTGTGSGKWELGEDPGVYAHEAGHLMGLPDRYDDYNKQPDGSWYSESAGKLFADDGEFAKYVVSKQPDRNLTDITEGLKKMDVYSIPKDGSKNDLMGDPSKPILQSDIDLITSNPGLLVNIPAGDILANRNNENQNLIITHSEDMFVKPGQRRTLNGVYGACIDKHNGVPDSVDVFDIIPSLDTWRGITAAGYMSKLIQYIDAHGLYCGSDFTSQSAIWLISNNEMPYSAGATENLLIQAGADHGDQALDFPRLTTKTQGDTTSLVIVPDQLFPANIQPRFIDGKIGSKTTFGASVLQPAVDGFSTTFSWVATGPKGSPVPVTANGDSASVTPDRRGITTVGLHVSVMDSSQGLRQFDSPQKAYVIVPDNYTETFEHAGLADRFPWKTYGDVPWRISNASAQTGSFSAEPGELSISNQTSTLEIQLSLPRDSVITFSVRTATPENVNRLYFRIDSVDVASFSGVSDWAPSEFPIHAGKHVLTWTTSKTGPRQTRLWLDNIFFPPNSIVSSVDGGEAIPAVLRLFQNYPNPFNPSTTIRYGLPNSSSVSLIVYNTLGQQVSQLVNGQVEAGYHEVKFDATNLSSGVYFYRIQAGSFVETKKLMLLR